MAEPSGEEHHTGWRSPVLPLWPRQWAFAISTFVLGSGVCFNYQSGERSWWLGNLQDPNHPHGDLQPLPEAGAAAEPCTVPWLREGKGCLLWPASQQLPVPLTGWRWQFSVPTPMASEVTSPVLCSVKPTFLTYFYFIPQWWSDARRVPCAGGTAACRMALLLPTGRAPRQQKLPGKKTWGGKKDEGSKEHLPLVLCSQQCLSSPVRPTRPAVKGKTQL